ncbi:protein ECT2 isoform X1 [Culicoides brevitarsis]|uniref:protein ECT2 isoform X1 n=1 Tax=Culicoides brevitarsis TaxID=469753 RepID=UPI00307BBB2C
MESLQEEQTSRRQSGSDVEMTTAPNSRGESQELTLPITKQTRICLVGGVCDDANTLQAAQKLGVPVIISETGLEYITDEKWNTYFVLDDFEGNNYSKINHAKQKILGPPALKYAVESGEGLPNNNRPIYNYAMRGTTTCFTGIRQKNVLIRLVNLIHFMGGSIRKDMNTKVTHLICNSSIGEKYQYAMTFRLPAIRPSWVTEAWESRDKEKFCAKEETFLREHKLKVFEGQKVCFFGFPPEEHQHMIDVLKSNGGIPTDMEDPECSHVIISNTGENFPEHIIPNPDSPTSKVTNEEEEQIEETKSNAPIPEIVVENNMNVENHGTSTFMSRLEELEKQEEPQTPSRATDGIILISKAEDKNFLNPNDISPILKSKFQDESLQRINEEDEPVEEEDGEISVIACKELFKRKRQEDSFDNISLVSTDSLAPSFSSAKKPKLIRTGSITKNLRRTMSFAAIKTPLSNMLRSRRNSASIENPNASITSISSINSTFNESIKKPVKEKLRSIKDKITKSAKKDLNTPKNVKGLISTSNLESLKKVCKVKGTETETSDDCTDFKTPLAPPRTPRINAAHAFSKSMISSNEFMAASSTTTPTSAFDRIQKNTEVEEKSDETKLDDQNPVVDEHVVQAKPEVRNNRTHIVKSDWFWYTIQNGYADETDYLFGDYLDSIANTPGAERRDSYPISFNKRKRKRLSQRILGDGTPVGSGTNKRRSSVSDAGLLSVSGSFLDCTATPEKHDGSKVIITDKDSSHELPSAKQMSMRRNHFMDFFHTESNYVGILETICKVFKEPLEKMLEENPEDSLLNSTELKGIFSNFLPIYEVHMKMLNMLKDIHSNWVEDCLIGQIIIKHRDDLLKAYPPYVNFFEQMKETLVQCDSQKPRFHAFLKICQTKPECGRQTLQDLMIRPVQRLPSISLLLKDILKHTAKTNPDHKCLSDALGAITEVMHDINEDKRKMEGQLAIFEIFNDIDNCPPHLVSSHRSFVSKLEVTELTDSLSGRGDSLVLFLFSDTLEVCKKRSRGFGTIKSPGTNALNSVKIQQEKKASYKHYKMMPLSSIRYVIDIHDNPRAFAINCKLCGDIKDKLYSFSICDEECDKIIYLKTLCKQMAENACRTETDKCLISCNSEELGIDVTDVNVGTLSRAFKFATKTRLKVGRAFSFNKTPSKLKRAVSTMMTSPTFGSTNSLTPSTQMAQMKLASCTNLNDHNSEDTVSQSSSSPTSSEILLAPMTVQPTRKNRVPIAALRRI